MLEVDGSLSVIRREPRPQEPDHVVHTRKKLVRHHSRPRTS